jgi:rhodanese-related sulfurtransferase
LGHWLGLSQQEFGTWAAIAIHDTSSVVGAGAAYGEEALKIATTIKLTRALWIIPLTLVTALIFRSDSKKVSIPWFILFFVVAIVVNTYLLNDVPQVGKTISGVARKALTITMFFIGASLSKETLKAVGIRTMIQGVVLWAIISVGSLAFICWSGETPRNEFRSVGVEEFAAEIAKEGVQIVDVRSKNEFDTGHIKGAVNIDVLQAEFPKQLSEKLDKERTVALYCRSGRRSKRAAEIAVKQGFEVVELDGGVLSWTGELEQ